MTGNAETTNGTHNAPLTNGTGHFISADSTPKKKNKRFFGILGKKKEPSIIQKPELGAPLATRPQTLLSLDP